MKKKIIIAGSLVLAIAVAFFGLLTYQHHQQKEKAKQEREKYENYDYYTGKWEIDSYQFLEDGQGVVVHWKSLTPEEDKLFIKYAYAKGGNLLGPHGASNKRYIVRSYFNNSTYRWTQKLPKEDPDVYFALSIYRIRDQKLEGSQVDLYKLVENYNPNYVPENTGGIEEINGKDYLPIKVYKLDSRNSKARQLWLNLETKKIEWEDGKIQKYPEKIPSVELGGLKKTLEDSTTSTETANLFDVYNQNQLTFFPNKLKGSMLEKVDPKAYQLLSKKDSQIYFLTDSKVDYYRVYGNVQQFIDLYQLFVPANTNLYEGITIPAELSKDGQVHQVNTKEEFETYYDAQKDNELNKQRRVLVEQN